MKQLYLTLLLLLYCAVTFAQKDFREGYVILNGDTIKGYVDYRGHQRSALTTSFKPSLEGAEQKYTPEEISAYGFVKENKLFESHLIPAADTNAVAQKLFLSTLVKGPASIYYYRDSFQKDHYYLLKGSTSLLELVQKEFNQTDPRTGKTYKVRSKEFLGKLAFAFSDCKSITNSQLENVELTTSSLLKIANQYNHCVAPAGTLFKQTEKKAKTTLGITVAYFNSSLKISGDTYLSKGTFNNSGLPVGGGLFANFSIPKLNEKLSIQTELLYLKSKYRDVINAKGNFGSTNTYDVIMDVEYLKLPALLRYTFPRGTVRPYFNGGIVGMWAISHKNEARKTHAFGGSASTSTETALLSHTDGFRKHSYGLTAGAGITYPLKSHTVSLEARYEANDGISSIKTIDSSTNTFYLLLGYSF